MEMRIVEPRKIRMRKSTMKITDRFFITAV